MNLTIYGYSIKVIKDGIKIDKDFQISIIEDRAFKYLCNVYPKVIIKFLVEVYGLDESLIESAYFVDPNEPDLRYDDKKITIDLLVNIAPNEYINIEANTSLSEGIRLKNTNYLFRLIMSKQITGKKLIDVKMLQINFDLYSEDTSNLMYYDKETMNESVRLTDLAFAKEKGKEKGII